jgi:hypothetical protein
MLVRGAATSPLELVRSEKAHVPTDTPDADRRAGGLRSLTLANSYGHKDGAKNCPG